MLLNISAHQVQTIAITLFAASAAFAGVTPYTDSATMIVDVTNFANFNDLSHGQSLLGYEEDGLRVSVNRTYYSWDAPGLDGSEMFYPNTGALELIDISLVSSENFQDLEMQVSSGWTPVSIGTVYTWVQLYDDGALVEEFNIDLSSGSYLGFVGGGYDRVMIGSYATSDIRDSRNPSERNAIALDNIRVGTFVPAPGSIALLPIGLMLCTRRSRA